MSHVDRLKKVAHGLCSFSVARCSGKLGTRVVLKTVDAKVKRYNACSCAELNKEGQSSAGAVEPLHLAAFDQTSLTDDQS